MLVINHTVVTLPEFQYHEKQDSSNIILHLHEECEDFKSKLVLHNSASSTKEDKLYSSCELNSHEKGKINIRSVFHVLLIWQIFSFSCFAYNTQQNTDPSAYHKVAIAIKSTLVISIRAIVMVIVMAIVIVMTNILSRSISIKPLWWWTCYRDSAVQMSIIDICETWRETVVPWTCMGCSYIIAWMMVLMMKSLEIKSCTRKPCVHWI